MTQSTAPQEYEEESNIEPWLAKIMLGLGVASIEANFSGGGDEGCMDDMIIYPREGSVKSASEIEEHLESLKIRQAANLQPSFLDKLKENIESDVEPLGDYANGDGGSAWIRIAITDHGAYVEGSDFTAYAPEEDEFEEDEDWQPDF
jgi:hypothetical protein|tara:strand:+ start:240 stop:680 length:441 start_codon:yes stop_codon:yes gene_type:complete